MTTTTPLSPPAVPLLATQDLQAVLNLAAGTLAVWMVPERWWGSPDHFIALQRLRFDRRWAARYRGRLTALLGPGPAASIDPIIVAYSGHLRTAKFQALRLRHPSGWRPTLRIEGRNHLEAALAARRGVILWVAPFIYASLVAKMTLHDAGFAAVQLSRYSHGFSRSRLGARLFNPIRTRVEDRFLAERIVIGKDRAVAGPLQALAHRLQDNRLVSIALGAAGTRLVRVPFLTGRIAVAGGAPGLAVKTGAALLPVVTLRDSDGGYTTIVEPMLVTPSTDRQGAVATLIAEMARRLEPYVRRAPDQFWWHSDIAESASVV